MDNPILTEDERRSHQPRKMVLASFTSTRHPPVRYVKRYKDGDLISAGRCAKNGYLAKGARYGVVNTPSPAEQTSLMSSQVWIKR
jgi:hypothetical protein